MATYVRFTIYYRRRPSELANREIVYITFCSPVCVVMDEAHVEGVLRSTDIRLYITCGREKNFQCWR